MAKTPQQSRRHERYDDVLSYKTPLSPTPLESPAERGTYSQLPIPQENDLRWPEYRAKKLKCKLQL